MIVDCDNPFTLVYNALWELLECNEHFKKLVRAGNMIRFAGKEADNAIAKVILKTANANADVPEVRILPRGTVPHIQRTSTSSFLTTKLEIQISSGSYKLDEVLFPVQWAVYRAMSTWQNVVMQLKWKDRNFVHLVRPLSSNDMAMDVDVMRGIPGWTALWSCEITMDFKTVDLE